MCFSHIWGFVEFAHVDLSLCVSSDGDTELLISVNRVCWQAVCEGWQPQNSHVNSAVETCHIERSGLLQKQKRTGT